MIWKPISDPPEANCQVMFAHPYEHEGKRWGFEAGEFQAGKAVVYDDRCDDYYEVAPYKLWSPIIAPSEDLWDASNQS